MELEIHRTLTGEELRREILFRYGSREALERAAKSPRAVQARDDRLTLGNLEKDPRRLSAEWTTGFVSEIVEKDLEAFTENRMRLLVVLGPDPRPVNVTELARSLGRDKKNVSQDLAILGRLGLIEMVRHGREAYPRRVGDEFKIVFAAKRRRRVIPGFVERTPRAKIPATKWLKQIEADRETTRVE